MSEDLSAFADDCAQDARIYLRTLTDVAEGAAPDAALPLTLLALSQVLLMGARLGAIVDVLPAERFEPDSGPDAEMEHLRAGLAIIFEGLDDYADVTDPVTDPTPASGTLVGDLVDVAEALAHGLSHHERGDIDEALWWWQFSYQIGVGGARRDGAAGHPLRRGACPTRCRPRHGRRGVVRRPQSVSGRTALPVRKMAAVSRPPEPEA